MIFSFLFSYGSCPRPSRKTKRSVRTQPKILCCFWLLQTTYPEEMKDVSTGPPVQLTLLSPTIEMLLLLSYAATFRPIDSTCLGSLPIHNNCVKLF